MSKLVPMIDTYPVSGRLRRAGSLLVALIVCAGCGHETTAPMSPDSSSWQRLNSTPTTPTGGRWCTRGTVEGYWIKNKNSETEGRIEAFWIRGRADTLGGLTGQFWYDSSSLNLRFEGTVSGLQLTVVLFEVSGTWMFNDPRLCPICGTGSGLFSGTWRDSRTGRRGRLSGEWGDLFLPFEERRMPLSGKWSAPCNVNSIEVGPYKPS